jgi:hypothetical protein
MGSARRRAAVREAIQHTQASIAGLVQWHGINPKAIAKWKQRQFVHDAPMGPKEVWATVLTSEEEALVVAFRNSHPSAFGWLPVGLFDGLQLR